MKSPQLVKFLAIALFICAGMVCVNASAPFVYVGTASTPQHQPQRHPKQVVEVVGTIERWVEGDTCFFIPDSDPGQKIRIRLCLVDAPESDQPGGALATEYVINHPEIGTGKHVILGMVGTDRYKRTLGELKGEHAGDYATADLLASGYFWPYYPALQRDISQERADELEKIFNATRAAKKGIFKDDNPIQPYLWRKKSKEERARIRAEHEQKLLGGGSRSH